MFWNDPNLYSVAFKDLPNYRHFHPYTNYPTPPITPQMFTPQWPPYTNYPTPPVTPQMFTPQYTNYPTPPVTPQQFTQQWPVTPWAQTLPMTPYFNPMMTPYNFNYTYFDRYRPFGL